MRRHGLNLVLNDTDNFFRTRISGIQNSNGVRQFLDGDRRMVGLSGVDELLDEIWGLTLQLIDVDARVEQESLPTDLVLACKLQLVVRSTGKRSCWK